MTTSEPGLLVLHALRLAGFADARTVADRLDLPVDAVERRLADAADDGFARHRRGARSGWALTEEGRKENERLLADELDHSGHREPVEELYHRFLPLNRELLAVCTAWQVRDPATGTLNDHTDPAHDGRVITRLAALDDAIQPIVAALGRRLARFDHYGPRLRRARQRVEAGGREWLTKPTIDSYHTVWFELHEDLLATLGLDRVEERARQAELEEHSNTDTTDGDTATGPDGSPGPASPARSWPPPDPT